MEYTALHYEKLSEQAKAPKRATPGLIGLDLFTPKDIFILPKQQVLIPTDLILVPTQGYYVRIASKSGLAFKHGLTVEGGVIDPDYRGNVGVLLRNNTDVGHTLEQGEAMAQVIMDRAAMPEVVEIKIARDTQRGAGGFGSSTGQGPTDKQKTPSIEESFDLHM